MSDNHRHRSSTVWRSLSDEEKSEAQPLRSDDFNSENKDESRASRCQILGSKRMKSRGGSPSSVLGDDRKFLGTGGKEIFDKRRESQFLRSPNNVSGEMKMVPYHSVTPGQRDNNTYGGNSKSLELGKILSVEKVTPRKRKLLLSIDNRWLNWTELEDPSVPFVIQRGARTVVYWDIENCCVPKYVDTYLVSGNIRSTPVTMGYTGDAAIHA